VNQHLTAGDLGAKLYPPFIVPSNLAASKSVEVVDLDEVASVALIENALTGQLASTAQFVVRGNVNGDATESFRGQFVVWNNHVLLTMRC
jgi:hypothetical protein